MTNIYQKILNNVADVINSKNTDYDRAFEKSFNKWGWSSYFIRIYDKLNRAEALTTNNTQLVKDESISDTLLDIIGYTVLLYEIINRNKEEE